MLSSGSLERPCMQLFRMLLSPGRQLIILYLKITKLVHCDDRLMYLVILRKQKADLAT